MTDRLDGLERRVDELTRRVDTLSLRVASLLPAPPPAAPSLPPAFDGPPAASRPAREDASGTTGTADPDDWTIGREFERLVAEHGLVFLSGLVCLVLAGAMVLRLVTMETRMSIATGALLGLGYCALLLVVAERKLRAGARLHGDTYAILAILILDVLLVEATHRSGGIGREFAYGVLGASLVALGWLAISKGRAIPYLAGLVAAPVAGIAIGGRPFSHPLFAGILALAVLGGHSAHRRRGWAWGRWWPGIASLLYLPLFGLIAAMAARRDLPAHRFAEPPWALAVFAAFFLLLVVPPAVAAVGRERRLDGYEITTAVAGAVVCLEGTAGVLLARPGGDLIAGGVGGALALVFYGTAAACFVRHGAQSGGFYALSAIAFLALLGSLPLLLGPGTPLAVAAAALAFGLAIVASRLDKRSLSFQAHVLAFFAFAVALFGEMRFSAPSATGLPVLLTGALTVAVFERLRSFVPPGERFSLTRPRASATALVLVLACGTLEVVAGGAAAAWPALDALADATAAADRTGLWHTFLTICFVAGAFATLVAGVRLRQGEVVLLAVALFGFAGLKLAVYDATHTGGHLVAVSAGVFGLVLLGSSVVYRRSRGLSTKKGDAA